MKRIVIGMTAHVDSGKTTLSEAMLFKGGEIRKAGRVDKGDAFLDTHSIERSRGITVFSKQAVLHLDGCEYTLLDTPGHTDFSAETERAFSALDMAILVISGSEGVQSHTETLWRMLSRYNIPLFVFVNKMDISLFDRSYVLSELKKRLSVNICDFSPTRDKDELYEEAASCDEGLMDTYLETGELSDCGISAAVSQRKIFPCYFGSALKMSGIDELLEGIKRFSVTPDFPEQFGARVFKITSENGTRLTHLKITGGVLKVRDSITEGEKVSRLRIYSGAGFTSFDKAYAGSVCAVEGLSSTYAGQGLGFEKDLTGRMNEPVLSYRVVYPPEIDHHIMMDYLKELEQEDPTLSAVWDGLTREIRVLLMGEIQLEILRTVIKERFKIDIDFTSGSIAYKETIAAPAKGMGHYEPLRHYAEVRLLLESAERGSGMSFYTDCSEDILSRNWQRLILTHLEEKQHIGVLTGSPITDMRITLVMGKAHLKHTEGGDFRQATYRAVRMGLMSAESVLLEPWYSFRLELPSGCIGRALSDLERMNAELDPIDTGEETAVITGSVPVSVMTGYHTAVAGYTSGKGRLSCEVKGYFPCHNTAEVAERIGYDAERDTENPADSVFCANGAGFSVSWRDVPDYMHTEDPSSPKHKETITPIVTPAEIARYKARLYDDDELMAIYERTYGKINRDKRYAVRKAPSETIRHKSKPLPKGPAYLLVDGYNIIFSWDELKMLAADNLDLARGRLTDILCNYQGFKQCNVILVFDAYKVKGTHREVEKANNITVVYTKEAETADMYIEKASLELSKDNIVRVATSDGAEQMIILGNGAFRISAAEFYEEVKAVEKAIHDIIDKPQLPVATPVTIKKENKNA